MFNARKPIKLTVLKEKQNLTKLIEALQIFAKYENPAYPTHCEHDVMMVCINPEKITEEDKAKLDELGFFTATIASNHIYTAR